MDRQIYKSLPKMAKAAASSYALRSKSIMIKPKTKSGWIFELLGKSACAGVGGNKVKLSDESVQRRPKEPPDNRDLRIFIRRFLSFSSFEIST